MKGPSKTFLNIISSLVHKGFEKFGRYYSSYRGFVADVNDPESLGRIKVIVPQITSKFVIDCWAWPKNVFSGNGYGSQVLPQKGDLVWVEFEMGNPRKPIWQFGHFTYLNDGLTNQKPENLRSVKNYWFKTPDGHLIELDDENKKIVVTLIEKLYLGSKDAESQAVLGDKLNEKLSDICDKISDLATQTAAITVSNSGGTTTPPTNAIQITAVGQAAEALKAELNEILSNKVYLE